MNNSNQICTGSLVVVLNKMHHYYDQLGNVTCKNQDIIKVKFEDGKILDFTVGQLGDGKSRVVHKILGDL